MIRKTPKIPTCLTAVAQSMSPNASSTTAISTAEVATTDHVIMPQSIITVGTVTVAIGSHFSNSKLGSSAPGINSTAFTAETAGSISISTLIDRWTIDEQKSIKNNAQGY